MLQNCKTQDFFVKSNIYTLLESLKVQVLEKICLQFFGARCHGNGPNFLKNIFFQNLQCYTLLERKFHADQYLQQNLSPETCCF